MRHYTISEVSKLCGIREYVLRYWESEFEELTPRKDERGRRIYTEEDLSLIRKIKELLYERGYKVTAVKKLLSEGNIDAVLGGENLLGKIKERLLYLEKLLS